MTVQAVLSAKAAARQFRLAGVTLPNTEEHLTEKMIRWCSSGEPHFIAQTGDGGCIVTQWHDATGVTYSAGAIRFQTDDGRVTLATSYVALRAPTDAGIDKLVAAGPCQP